MEPEKIILGIKRSRDTQMIRRQRFLVLHKQQGSLVNRNSMTELISHLREQTKQSLTQLRRLLFYNYVNNNFYLHE